LTPCWIAAGSGSIEGSEYGRSPVATSFTQSVEPATGTSCTLIPAGAYQPFFIAMAKGAAAEVMVRAQNPTLTTDSAARPVDAEAMSAASIATIDFMGHLSAKRCSVRLSGRDPRTGRAGGPTPARR